MSEISQLFRPHLIELAPYSSARDEFSGAAAVMLDANENSENWLNITVMSNDLLCGVNRYPDPHQREIKNELACIKKVVASQIFIGNGSDETIDLVLKLFCVPGKDKVIILPPTYGMYSVSAQIHNLEVVRIPLTADFEPNVGAIADFLKEETAKVLFLCSPNNPTANACGADIVKEILDIFPGIVVVDEAYIDFSRKHSSVIGLLARYPRLIISQTFSKAWGMAGLRVGMAFADEEVIKVMDRIKAPYNVNLVSQRLVLAALKEEAEMKEIATMTIGRREKLRARLVELPFVKRVYPSDANFLLVKFSDSARVFAFLVKSGVVVRDRSKELLCDNCLRITVGSYLENEKLLDALCEFANNE